VNNRVACGVGVRVVISGLFLYSGWIKALDPEAFARSIQGYRLVGEGWVAPLTWGVPWLEIWCAAALWVTPLFRRSAWLLLAGMLCVFTFAKFAALARGLDISCGCTGGDSPLTWQSVALNLVWMGLAACGLWADRRWRRKVPEPPE